MRMTTRTWIGAGACVLAARAGLADDPRLAAELRGDAAGRAAAPANEQITVDVHGQVMFRFNLNRRDGSDTNVIAAGGEESTWGFNAAYTKLSLGGKLFNEAWNYGVQFKFSESSGAASLDDAWASHKFEGGATVKWGQFKLPFMKEETNSDTLQLSSNRSVMNSTFSVMRAQMVQFSYEGDQTRFIGALSDGQRTNNTDFDSSSEADFGLTGRAEYKWDGDWKAARDFTSFKGSPFLGVAGLAAHYQDGGASFNTSDASLLGLTADVQIEGDGWNAYGAGVYRRTEVSGSPSFTDYGFLAQGGVFVSPSCELFARYDVTIPDGDRATDDSLHAFTLGLNHYCIPNSHAAKFTADFVWFSGTQANSIAPASTLTGLLPSDQDSQYTFQLQMQIVF